MHLFWQWLLQHFGPVHGYCAISFVVVSWDSIVTSQDSLGIPDSSSDTGGGYLTWVCQSYANVCPLGMYNDSAPHQTQNVNNLTNHAKLDKLCNQASNYSLDEPHSFIKNKARTWETNLLCVAFHAYTVQILDHLI